MKFDRLSITRIKQKIVEVNIQSKNEHLKDVFFRVGMIFILFCKSCFVSCVCNIHVRMSLIYFLWCIDLRGESKFFGERFFFHKWVNNYLCERERKFVSFLTSLILKNEYGFWRYIVFRHDRWLTISPL